MRDFCDAQPADSGVYACYNRRAKQLWSRIIVTSEELRQAFLDFFVARGHEVVRSASLVPHGDPTLLFTSAGMVPFKPYFLGRERPPAPRLTSIQRCFRATDIE